MKRHWEYGLQSLRENPVSSELSPEGVCVIAKSEGVGRVPQVRQPAPACRGSVPGPKKTDDPDFLVMAPNRSACAVPAGRDRMKFANANNLHRKSGEAHHSFLGYRPANPLRVDFSAVCKPPANHDAWVVT
jgi:hypothetical protein